MSAKENFIFSFVITFMNLNLKNCVSVLLVLVCCMFNFKAYPYPHESP